MKKAIIWGASGHAKVIFPILKNMSCQLIATIDLDVNKKEFLSYPVFNSFHQFLESKIWDPNEALYFAIAIGTKGKDRLEIQDLLINHGLIPLSLVHPRAWVAETAKLGRGSQVLGMAAISEYAEIGEQTIINTNASVDHETLIGKGCHIMPGVTIAGCVQINDLVMIGSNATILPRVIIETGAVIGAGAVVTKNVSKYQKVIGVPARSQC